MNSRTPYYVACTAVLVLIGVVSGLGDLTRSSTVVADLQQLGYPVYVATIVGVAKVLGVLAILLPGRPGLKEWAYAGFVFDFAGAVISSLAVGVVDGDTALAAIALAVTAASYLTHRGRLRSGLPIGVAALRRRQPALRSA